MEKNKTKKVHAVAQQILRVLEDSENYLFSELTVENEVEEVLDQIIKRYLGEPSCEGDCECSSEEATVVVSYSVVQKLLLMLVQAKIEAEDLSECLLEIEGADVDSGLESLKTGVCCE